MYDLRQRGQNPGNKYVAQDGAILSKKVSMGHYYAENRDRIHLTDKAKYLQQQHMVDNMNSLNPNKDSGLGALRDQQHEVAWCQMESNIDNVQGPDPECASSGKKV